MPWLSNLPISEAQKIDVSAHHDHFVLGQMHHSMSFQLIVVPDHTKQTLLKQCFASQTSLIMSNLGVPVATHSCPSPALLSAHYANVLHHPGSSDVGQREHQGHLLRRNIHLATACNGNPVGVRAREETGIFRDVKRCVATGDRTRV